VPCSGARYERQVRERVHLGVARMLGRQQEATRDHVPELPQVRVAERGDRTQHGGIRTLVVVELQAAMSRIVVVDLQVYIDRLRQAALLQRGDHLTFGRLVQVGELLLRVGEVGHLTLQQRRHGVTNRLRRRVLRAVHPQSADLRFDHLQHDHTVLHLLPRQLHHHRLVAPVLVHLLQRVTRGVDVVERAARTLERINRLLYVEARQRRVAAHDVFVHIEMPPLASRIRCGRGSARGSWRGLCGRRSVRLRVRRTGQCHAPRQNHCRQTAPAIRCFPVPLRRHCRHSFICAMIRLVMHRPVNL
jgi:hypothetical protein